MERPHTAPGTRWPPVAEALPTRPQGHKALPVPATGPRVAPCPSSHAPAALHLSIWIQQRCGCCRLALDLPAVTKMPPRAAARSAVPGLSARSPRASQPQGPPPTPNPLVCLPRAPGPRCYPSVHFPRSCPPCLRGQALCRGHSDRVRAGAFHPRRYPQWGPPAPCPPSQALAPPESGYDMCPCPSVWRDNNQDVPMKGDVHSTCVPAPPPRPAPGSQEKPCSQTQHKMAALGLNST